MQIIGFRHCKRTQKAIRFCQERSLAYQFVDLAKRSLSVGEWRSIFASLEPTTLIDSSSRYYQREGYAYRIYDAQEELMEHPELLYTPILRSKGKAVAGFDAHFLAASEVQQ